MSWFGPTHLERMRLIRECCPALTDDDKILALQRLLATTSAHAEVKQETALKALRLLDNEDDGQMFSNLRDKLEDVEIEKTVIERFGPEARASKHFVTPQCLKDLRPDTALSGNSSNYSAVLVWQISAQSFQGYYPNDLDEEDMDTASNKRRQRFMSCSRKYVADTLEEKFKALNAVVNFLWREHAKQGGSNHGKPSKDDLESALLKADQDFKDGKCSVFSDLDVERMANLKAEDAPPSKVTKSVAKGVTPGSAKPLKIAGGTEKPKAKGKKRKSSTSSREEKPIDFDEIKAKKATKKRKR